MKNSAFNSVTFNYGWNVKSTITLWDKQFNIVVTAKAYSKTEPITKEQEVAYATFLANLSDEQHSIEALLESFAESKIEAKRRFRPTTMLFQKDGSYSLLCDDKDLPDEGIAVCLTPKKMVLSQDAYL